MDDGYEYGLYTVTPSSGEELFAIGSSSTYILWWTFQILFPLSIVDVFAHMCCEECACHGYVVWGLLDERWVAGLYPIFLMVLNSYPC